MGPAAVSPAPGPSGSLNVVSGVFILTAGQALFQSTSTLLLSELANTTGKSLCREYIGGPAGMLCAALRSFAKTVTCGAMSCPDRCILSLLQSTSPSLPTRGLARSQQVIDLPLSLPQSVSCCMHGPITHACVITIHFMIVHAHSLSTSA